MEKEDQVLPDNVWPACGSRKLVCTREAAIRMNEIVDTIGTGTEKRRRDYLLEVLNTYGWSREQRIKAFQELSHYPLPLDWQLPITVVDAEIAVMFSGRWTPFGSEHLVSDCQNVF